MGSWKFEEICMKYGIIGYTSSLFFLRYSVEGSWKFEEVCREMNGGFGF